MAATGGPDAKQFGRFELGARLGRGGMAETWKGQMYGAAGVKRPVVIKRILPNYVSEAGFIEAFINEARVSALLNHGNIAQVLDFGEIEGEYFLAMEYVHGRTLEQLLDRAATKGLNPLPAHVATFVVTEVLKGLHYAHTRTDEKGQPLNIVHRDVSPDNILVGFDGQVKLLDFGVAKARLLGRAETEPGLVKGKWHYFSPEQATAAPLDARSDVFAAGIVLYQCICGRLPFEGQAHVAMNAIAEARYPPPLTVERTLDPALCEVVQRALIREPAGRFQSAAAMENALERLMMKRHSPFSGEAMQAFMHHVFADQLAGEGVAQLRATPDPVPIAELPTDRRRALQAAVTTPERARAIEPMTDANAPTLPPPSMASPASQPTMPRPAVPPLASAGARFDWKALVAAALVGMALPCLYIVGHMKAEHRELPPARAPAPVVREVEEDPMPPNPAAAPSAPSASATALAELEKAWEELVRRDVTTSRRYQLKVRMLRDRYSEKMGPGDEAAFVQEAEKLRAALNKAANEMAK
jgi:eukaryotic-like serine/threonine-protein kinase